MEARAGNLFTKWDFQITNETDWVEMGFLDYKRDFRFTIHHFTKELILENREKGYWNLNLVPFKSIKSYFDFKYGINYINIFANTVPFILLSLLFSLAKKQSTKPLTILLLCLGLIRHLRNSEPIENTGFFDFDKSLSPRKCQLTTLFNACGNVDNLL